MRTLSLLLALILGSCDGIECIVVPGPDVEPGLYTLNHFWSFPEGSDVTGLPYADAEDMTIALSDDRSVATVRYIKDGVEIEETWRVDIVP